MNENYGQIDRLRAELDSADAVVIGAGAGLSTAAGFTYSGERFEKYFGDFAARFGITDMYSGGFYPFPDEETRWAWWSRHIYYNRYIDPPKPVYQNLLALVRDKDHFVITTNVDHQFQRAGFDKRRLFYTQGDYGLFQSARPGARETFDEEPVAREMFGAGPEARKTCDNEEWVMAAMEAQGFIRDDNGIFQIPEDGAVSMRIPSSLIPLMPDGSPAAMNLRADDTFVEDEGWHRAAKAYTKCLAEHEGRHVLFLELGVGGNTPAIIKYPFWRMTFDNKKAVYACINHSEAFCPKEIEDRSICIDGDIAEILEELA